MHVAEKAVIKLLSKDKKKYPLRHKHKIIKTQTHFKQFFKSAKYVECESFKLYSTPHITEEPKFAVISSKRTGNPVVRNKNKRQLRSVLRLNQFRIGPRYDMILMAKHKLNQTNYETINKQFLKLMQNL